MGCVPQAAAGPVHTYGAQVLPGHRLFFSSSSLSLKNGIKQKIARKLNPEANIWEISKPVLEDWIKSEKGPEGKIKKTIDVSKEVFEKIPDLPDVMDKANLALQMLAEGKLNLNSISGKNLEMEELKMKNLRNNMIIVFLGVVITIFIVF